jgi:uncharacterized protein (DUF3820 family)
MTRHKDLPIPFGKYRGQLVADIPCSYLGYLRDQEWFVVKFKDLHDQVVIETEFRKKFDITIE